MARTKRNKRQRERDLAQVSEWYCQGWYQHEMAAQLNLSQQQISYDLKEVRKRWLDASNDAVETVVMETLAKYDLMERELWESWHLSREDSEAKTMVMLPGGDGDEKSATVSRITGHTQTNKPGNPQFIQLIQGVCDRRLALLGIFLQGRQARAAQGQIIDGEIVGGKPVTDAERIRRSAEIITLARSRISEITGDGESESVGNAPDQLDTGIQATE